MGWRDCANGQVHLVHRVYETSELVWLNRVLLLYESNEILENID